MIFKPDENPLNVLITLNSISHKFFDFKKSLWSKKKIKLTNKKLNYLSSNSGLNSRLLNKKFNSFFINPRLTYFTHNGLFFFRKCRSRSKVALKRRRRLLLRRNRSFFGKIFMKKYIGSAFWKTSSIWMQSRLKILKIYTRDLNRIPSTFFSFYQLDFNKKKWLKYFPYNFFFINYKRQLKWLIKSFYFSKVNKTVQSENSKKYFKKKKDYYYYRKLLRKTKKLVNPNHKARNFKVRKIAKRIWGINTYSKFKLEISKFFIERRKKFFFFKKYEKRILNKKKNFFFVDIVVSNRSNSISFSDWDHKLILKRTTKSSGFKSRKLRGDIVKTKFLFHKIFYLFKNFIKVNFKIRKLNDYLFIFCLAGDITKTSKILKHIISSFNLKIFSIKDVSTLPHNGCRAPKKRRKKNRGRNRYVKKIKNC